MWEQIHDLDYRDENTVEIQLDITGYEEKPLILTRKEVEEILEGFDENFEEG